MDWSFCKLKKAQKHGFKVLQAKKVQKTCFFFEIKAEKAKKHDLMFCKVQKFKNMYLIFCKLKKYECSQNLNLWYVSGHDF